MKTIVIYHAGCWDGFCAAWVLRKVFPAAEFHAAHYGTEPPDVAGKDVFVVDFCYKRPMMVAIAVAAKSLTVLDHHKTAEADLTGLPAECNRLYGVIPNVIFKMDRSGGRLAWEWAFNSDPAPWLVDYTEDRDLWRWALPHSHDINAALRSYPLDFTRWDQLETRDPASLAAEGVAINRREAQIVDQHVRHAREIELGGYKVLAVNATVLFSEIAGKLAEGRPFGACYFDRADGLRQWSLRSDPKGVDVSEVAVRLGGGGHKHAAGFEERPPTLTGVEVLEGSP